MGLNFSFIHICLLYLCPELVIALAGHHHAPNVFHSFSENQAPWYATWQHPWTTPWSGARFWRPARSYHSSNSRWRMEFGSLMAASRAHIYSTHCVFSSSTSSQLISLTSWCCCVDRNYCKPQRLAVTSHRVKSITIWKKILFMKMKNSWNRINTLLWFVLTSMVRLQKRINGGLKMLQYYTTREWTFQNDNLHTLANTMTPADRETFYFDIKVIDWSSYIRDVWIGAKVFYLKENMNNLPKARKRMRRWDNWNLKIHFSLC